MVALCSPISFDTFTKKILFGRSSLNIDGSQHLADNNTEGDPNPDN